MNIPISRFLVHDRLSKYGGPYGKFCKAVGILEKIPSTTAELEGIYLALKIAQQELGDSQREVLIWSRNSQPSSNQDHGENSNMGIEGNKAADVAAKEATRWKSKSQEGARVFSPSRTTLLTKTRR
ncbi:hypothetical protein N431DRAFT_447080 [Stipitochalara longipes BDJ]|nr:hypothetical protein N431DRAFT_447080 [Stipitochalara longipes BDJ]